jgi:hypothetical protein
MLCIAGIVYGITNKHGIILRRSSKANPSIMLAQAKEDPPPHNDDKDNENVPHPAVPKMVTRSEMIAFKDNAIGEIRIKFL